MIKQELSDSIATALTFALSNLHTMTVAKITEVGSKTISCQPVINRVVNGESITLPEFTEVPPIFLNGGSSYLAMPIAVGDYCLLFFCERSFDKWYYGSDFESPIKPRMHDYSDGFALVGIKNQSGSIAIPDVITMIGDAFMQGNHELVGNETVTGDRNQTGTLTASVLVAGNGYTGTFPVHDGRTVTVEDGIIVGVG